jgi:DNA-binding PadR family transcriptional regulator
MSLDHAILGFLSYQPLSGYDLKKVFDVSVRHFWPADQSQIYRTLSRLEQTGLVEMEVFEQTERPDRKVYHITGAGRTELHNWLASQVDMPELRTAPLIQVFFAAQLSDEEILVLFQHAAEQLQATLARYDEVPGLIEEQMADFKSPRDAFFWMLTLESGYRTARTRLEWAQEIIQRIKDGKIPGN